jgi:hypothetical protein
MVGIFLKERELQYTANKDETTNTWRILDTWHNDLVNLGPDDEVPDDSSAVTILTEGAFIALVKEAARQGVLQNANLGGGGGGDSDEELMEKDEEIADLKALLGTQGKKVETKIPKRTEGYMLKEMAMTNILKIVSIADIESLTEE